MFERCTERGHPLRMPERPPGVKIAAGPILTGENLGRREGGGQRPVAGLILQQGGQSVPLPLQVLNIAPLRHDIDPGEKVAPDVAQQLFRRKGFRADGIHRVEVHTKHRPGEEEQEQGQAERGTEFESAPSRCQPVCQVLHGQPASAGRRRHDREDNRIDGMHENIGEQDAEGGKFPDLGQRGESADRQERKADRRGQHGQQAQRPDLPGRFQAVGPMGTVQEQEVGYAVIDGEGDDGAAEADGHHGNGGMEERIHEEAQHGPHHGGQQRQQPDEGPRKGNQQKRDDGDG